MNWPLAKEICGFVGTLFMLVPWLRDYRGRHRLQQTQQTRALGSLGEVKTAAVAQRRHWLDRPKRGDLSLTTAGLILIAVSFVIGVVLAVQPPGTAAG